VVIVVRISVDSEACEGYGQCYLTDENLFTLDEDGYCNIGVGKEAPSKKLLNAEMAVHNCPVGALSIDEE
jgi:ferredoxin